MKQSEFDKFADEYRSLHKSNIKLSGESPDYFAEYKIVDIANLIKKANLPDNLRILDFGCGVGNSVPFIKKHLPDAHLTCLDVSRKSLDIAKSLYADLAEFKVFDGNIIPSQENSFDLVFAACVFHHIPHDEHDDLFKEIFRVIKPGGIVVIFEHNPLNPLTVHAVNTCPFDENAVLIRAGVLKDLITRSGFTGSMITYRVFFPGVVRFLRGLERFLTRFPIGAQYYVSAVKRQ
jgi:ubiquinone/menaquinone biosynthesis C-methylase UbiE